MARPAPSPARAMPSWLAMVLTICAAWALVTIPVQAAANAEAAPSLTQHITRTLDLTTQLVRENVTITLENTDSAPLATYTLLTPDAARLAYLVVKDKTGTVLATAPTKTGPNGPEAWEVTFSPAISAGTKLQFSVLLVYTGKLAPLPARLKMLEPQFVQLDHTLHFYSPYRTAKERTTVTLPPGGRIQSKTEQGASVEGSKIVYGPFTDVAARDQNELTIHYENNAPFAHVTRLERTLEVSHWGDNLAVEEFFDVEHQGAELEGSFSRADFMLGMQQVPKSNTIMSFSLPLPLTATDIYYRDIIGNISTSTMSRSLAKGSINLTLEPRYPLFGGWKTKWYHGWNEPLSTVLYHRKDRAGYVLQVPLATLFDNAVVDQFIFKVTLPEGATNIELHSGPVKMDDIHFEVTKTYLDSVGRPVLVASRSRLVNDHNVRVYITYELPSYALLNEPFLLTVFFMILFVTGMVYVRIDLSISKDLKSSQRDLIENLIFEALAAADATYAAFEALQAALETLRQTKNTSVYKHSKDKAEATLKQQHEALLKTAGQLRSIDEGLSGRVTELARLFEDKLGKVRRQHTEVLNAQNKPETANAARAALAVLETEIAALDSKVDDIVGRLDN